MAYEEQKEWMRKQFISNGRNRPVLGDEDGGGSHYVAACTYHGGGINHTGVSQACHAHVPYMSRSFEKLEVMLDHIQGDTREFIGKVQTPEESVAYLQYFMDHPIFSKSFLEHDAELAFKERIMVRDITTLPSNVCMFAIIATRGLWEVYQNKLPHRLAEIRKLVNNVDLAYLLSWYFDDTLKYSPILNTGHVAIGHDKLTLSGARNYVKHQVIREANGTLAQGHPHMGGEEYNVFSIFEKNFIAPYDRNPKDNLFVDFVQSLTDKQTKQISLDNLKEIEEKICE